MAKLNAIVKDIESATGRTINNHRLSSVGGGSINTTYQLETTDQSYFIKLNQPQLLAMFEAEARGLEEMRSLNCIRIPDVICYGQADGYSYIVLEYIELGSLRGNAGKLLGTQLAQMHSHQQSYFGWFMENTIGSTPQINEREHDWLIFWQQNRLGKQLKFARQNGYSNQLQNKGQQLIERLPAFFVGYTPTSSLLHGDLWGGNAGADPQGNPVIFDPACYYGDRETDIAMTELFGGFGSDFCAAYQAECPLDPGYTIRKTLYNLYHIINHLNLFGGSYLSQAESMIDQLLAEL